MMDERKLAHQNIGSENSRTSADKETRITIRDDDEFEDRGGKNGDFGDKSKGLILNKELNDDGLRVEEDQHSCVEDVKCGKLERDSQKLCRICHLSRLENEKDVLDFIELGCGCRGELGFAHSVCAEAWFKLKGNRYCEICEEIAKNITGVSDSTFIEEWNENGLAAGAAASSGRRGCWQGQPICNFLMACLVLAFVLPWFFHVNMF